MNPDGRRLSQIIEEGMRVRGVSFDKLAQLTGISERFLEFILDEKFEQLPSMPYVRGYLMKIADVLQLDGNVLWEEYKNLHPNMKRSGKKDHLPQNRFIAPRMNRKIVLVVFLIIVFGFLIFRLPFFTEQSELTLTNIEDNMIVTSSTFRISGTVRADDTLTLNDEEVYPDASGIFETDVLLQEGLNTLTFRVKRLLGKEYSVTKNIIFNASTITAPTSTDDNQ